MTNTKTFTHLFNIKRNIKQYNPDDFINMRVINTKTNKNVSLADYEDLWEYRYQLDIRKEGILKRKLKKLKQLLVKYASKDIQLQVKYNNRYIPYDTWLEIKQ